MNRRAHGIGRVVTCAGLLSTGGYLGWRLATLPGHTPTWLVVLALAVEMVGFVGSALLAWALWPAPTAIHTGAQIDPGDVDVVVRVDRQPVHQVRASLLAMQSMTSGRHVVVDLGARLEIAALAAEFETVYAAPDIDDHNGLKTCSAASSTPIFLLLDAGDIPSADAIAVLLPMMDDDRVAVAIGQSLMADDDSAEHGPNGLHELTFERETLNPALGRRGAAILGESGALIRCAAVDSVAVGDDRPIEAQAQWSVALMEQGWSVVAAVGEPVLVRQVIQSQDEVYERRVMQARVARTMLLRPRGDLPAELASRSDTDSPSPPTPCDRSRVCAAPASSQRSSARCSSARCRCDRTSRSSPHCGRPAGCSPRSASASPAVGRCDRATAPDGRCATSGRRGRASGTRRRSTNAAHRS